MLLVHKGREGENPVFIQPGFAEHPSTFEAFSRALHEKGPNVLANAHANKESKARLSERLEAAKKRAHGLYQEKIAAGVVDPTELQTLLDRITLTIFAEAEAFISLVEDGSIDRSGSVRAVLHSQGSLIGLAAATLRPDLFSGSTLVLVNPSGFTGKRETAAEGRAPSASSHIARNRKDSFWKTFNRGDRLQFQYVFALISALAAHGTKMLSTTADNLRYIGAHTLNLGIFKEAQDMANTDALPFAQFLHRTIGADIYVVADTSDKVFPYRAIKERLQDITDIALHTTTGEGHFGPVHNPKKLAEVIGAIVGR